MRLLVTRPLQDAERTARALRERGHEPVVAPILTVNFHSSIKINFDGAQGVLITSANGIRALDYLSAPRHLKIFAVGPASAEEARIHGFTRVRYADGDTAALYDLVKYSCLPGRGRLIHISGSVRAGDLKAMLEAEGFEVERHVAYEARALDALPDALATALEGAPALPDGGLFFSPRSAAIFAELVTKAGKARHCAKLDAFCLSDAVAEALTDLPFHAVHVSPSKEQSALLDFLD